MHVTGRLPTESRLIDRTSSGDESVGAIAQLARIPMVGTIALVLFKFRLCRDQPHVSYESTHTTSLFQGEERGTRDGRTGEHAVGTVAALAREASGIGSSDGTRVALD